MIASLHWNLLFSRCSNHTSAVVHYLNVESLSAQVLGEKNARRLTRVSAGGVAFCSMKEATLIFESRLTKSEDNLASSSESFSSILMRSERDAPTNLDSTGVARLATPASSFGNGVTCEPRCGVDRNAMP